jgi:MFS family permease
LIAWGARAVLFPAFALALIAGAGDLAFGLVLVLNGLSGAFFSIVSVAGITTALDLSPRRAKGEAVGAYNSVTGLGMIVGGLVGGVVAGLAGYLTVVLATGLIMLVAILLLLRVTFAPPESS